MRWKKNAAVRVKDAILNVSDAYSILNVSDTDPNYSNVHLLCMSNQPTSQSKVHLLKVHKLSQVHANSKQPTIDPQVLSVVHTNSKQPTYDINSYSRKLQMNKKYTVIKNTVLIPCTKKKLPASVRVHFSTTSTTLTVPET